MKRINQEEKKLKEKKISEDKEIQKKIINKIKEIRTVPTSKNKIRIPQADLSKLIGEHTRYISNLEKGNSKDILTLPNFIRICKALNVSSSEILAELIPEDTVLNNLNSLKKDEYKYNVICKFLTELTSEQKNKTTVDPKMFDDKLLGKKIKLYRKEKGLKANDLSKKLGGSSSYISNIENGYSKISISNFIDICNALECTPNDLLNSFINNTEKYDNLTSENKKLVDLLIKVCNRPLHTEGESCSDCIRRQATEEEKKKYKIV